MRRTSTPRVTRRLSICLVASSRFPVREPFMGGLEAHTHALVEALVRRGHQVSLFAAPGSDPALGATVLPLAAYEMSPAARADVGTTPEAWMQEHHAYLDLMLGIARGRHGPFDVVHNNSLHHLPVAMSQAIDAPVVTTLHTPPIPWLESAVAFAAPHSRFVAVSACMAEAWRPSVASEVIRNGVDTDFWRPGSGGGPAVWSGRLVPEKAPHHALEAAALAGIPLVLAGPMHDRGYFEEEIAPRLGRNAVYAGHLQRSTLRELIGAASVAVVTPQWDEPFGLVAAEAMACGTPVAGYAQGALPEIVDARTGVLVEAGEVETLAAAIRDARTCDRTAVRRRACDHFSHARMVDEYEATYLRMAGLPSAA